MRVTLRYLIIITILLVLVNDYARGGNESKYGTISGRATDSISGEPLIGASIAVDKTDLGAITDIDGRYIIRSVLVGSHTISFEYISSVRKTIESIVVTSSDTTILNVGLTSCWDARGPLYYSALQQGQDSAAIDMSAENYFLFSSPSDPRMRESDTIDYFSIYHWDDWWICDEESESCDSITKKHGFTSGHDEFVVQYCEENDIPVKKLDLKRRLSREVKNYFDYGRSSANYPIELEIGQRTHYSTDSTFSIRLGTNGLKVTDKSGNVQWFLKEIISNGTESMRVSFYWGHVSEDYLAVRYAPSDDSDYCYFAIDLLDGSVTPESCITLPD